MRLEIEALTPEGFEAATGRRLADCAGDCHGASLALVRSGILGQSRVARGFCRGVPSQHSWVVLGWDCYAPHATIVDPTLWSYDDTISGIYTGRMGDRPHLPHGAGSIWEYGRPAPPTDEVIELEGEFSPRARKFLDILGPLDRRGWGVLARSPVEEWPAQEILAAMWQHPEIGDLVPIDHVGMVTNLNPAGCYF